jgi:hypothetical protein
MSVRDLKIILADEVLRATLTEDELRDMLAHVRQKQPGLPETYPAPPDGWVCFHCGERFRSQYGARLHFGPGDAQRPPQCQTETDETLARNRRRAP